MTYPWILIEHNGAAIAEDFALYARGRQTGAALDPSTAFTDGRGRVQGTAPVHLGRGTVVGAFVSFDVSEGPIIVEENVTIESHCHIKGPAYVGSHSTLWAFADVKEGCSLGPWSRVCGQIEEVIFQGYAHKFHVGFVGHSYIGEGVNLGDQTVTSNLKNDRSPVHVQMSPEAGRQIDTGRLYCGSLIGDGAATGTNTNLTTGAVVEPLSTVVSPAATPKYVNGFLYDGRHLPWPFANAYGALRILLEERMQRSLPEGHEALFRHVYDEMRGLRRILRRSGRRV
jgi:acetyltransferase-like isoleucine patch superfamily enzyme